jgi:hypothetical protein
MVQLRVPDGDWDKLTKAFDAAGLELKAIHKPKASNEEHKKVTISMEDTTFEKVKSALAKANLEIVAYPGGEEDKKEEKGEGKKEESKVGGDASSKGGKSSSKGKSSSSTDSGLWEEIGELWEAINELKGIDGKPKGNPEKDLPPFIEKPF